MKALTSRKWDGVLSLVWTCGLFVALKLGEFHSGSTTLSLFILSAWWGVAILLAVSGVRSGSPSSVLAGLGTGLTWRMFAKTLGVAVTSTNAPASTQIGATRST
jgi:hypothetical protein